MRRACVKRSNMQHACFALHARTCGGAAIHVPLPTAQAHWCHNCIEAAERFSPAPKHNSAASGKRRRRSADADSEEWRYAHSVQVRRAGVRVACDVLVQSRQDFRRERGARRDRARKGPAQCERVCVSGLVAPQEPARTRLVRMMGAQAPSGVAVLEARCGCEGRQGLPY